MRIKRWVGTSEGQSIYDDEISHRLTMDEEIELSEAALGADAQRLRECLGRLADDPARLHVAAQLLLVFAVEGKPIAVAALARPDVLAREVSGPSGKTPLMMAATGCSVACVEILLPVSDAKRRDAQGLDALSHAARWGDWSCDCVMALLPHSEPNGVDGNGQTALHHVCERASDAGAECARLLHPCCDPEKTNDFGESALGMAAKKGRFLIAKLLLEESDPSELRVTEALARIEPSLANADEMRSLLGAFLAQKEGAAIAAALVAAEHDADALDGSRSRTAKEAPAEEQTDKDLASASPSHSSRNLAPRGVAARRV
jgi:hypothetical protein